MSHVFPHSDRKGTEAALDLVEETLASLRKRVEKQQQQQQKESKMKDAATNTTPPPPPPPSITSSKASKKPRNKSVLIKRKSKYKGKRTTHTNNSSVQEDLGTQVFEKEPEKAPQEYCRHCNPRSEGGKSKASSASHERRKRITKPSPGDPELPGVREKVIWKHIKRNIRRKQELEDSFQDCLCHGNTCRPLYDDPDPPDVRERVIWKPKKGHRRREESEYSFQDCLCHSNTCRTQRPAGPLHEDPEPPGVREKIWRHGKRCHSRREESDSSCHSNTRKTHRRTRSSSKPKQPTQEGKSTDIGTSRERKEKREKDASNQVCKQKEQAKGKDKKAPTHQRPPADIEHQGYAQPTITSRLRTDHSYPKKKEKENIIPYIPCGSKSHSYHVGVIAQQEIGHLISQPLREHTHTSLQGRSRREGVAATCLTEETVRQAMANIHHHLRGHTVHSDPDQ